MSSSKMEPIRCTFGGRAQLVAAHGSQASARGSRRPVLMAVDVLTMAPRRKEAERVVAEKLAEALGGLSVQVARETKVGAAQLGGEAAARQHGQRLSRRQQRSGRDRLRGGGLGFHLLRLQPPAGQRTRRGY